MNRRNKYSFLMFLAADTGGAGGAATAEAPAAPDTGSADDPISSITSYEPPAIDLGEGAGRAFGAGDTPSNEPAPAPAQKKEEPKPKEPPKEQKDAKGEPPAAQLRRRLQEVEKERDEKTGSLTKEIETLRAERDTLRDNHPRVKEIDQELAAARKELQEVKARAEDYEKRALLSDPYVAKEVVELQEKFKGEQGRFFQRVPELAPAQVHSLLLAYENLPFGQPEYREKRQEFESQVEEALGSSRKVDTVLDFLEGCREYDRNLRQTVQSVQKDAFKRKFDGERQDYEKKATRVKDLIAKAVAVPEGLEQSHPYHPRVALSKLDAALGQDKVQELDKGISDFVLRVMAGMAPRADEDYGNLPPEKIKAAKDDDQQRWERDRDVAVQMLVEGERWRRRGPGLVKELQRLYEVLGSREKAVPPDPTSNGGQERSSGEEELAVPEIPRLTH